MRAAALNPVSSRLVGVRVGWMLALGWGLAAAIGSVAGCMVAPVVFLDPNMMSGILLYAFAGALLGGIDSPLGAVLGGFAVGIIENLGGAYIVGTELKLNSGAGHYRFGPDREAVGPDGPHRAEPGVTSCGIPGTSGSLFYCWRSFRPRCSATTICSR